MATVSQKPQSKARLRSHAPGSSQLRHRHAARHTTGPNLTEDDGSSPRPRPRRVSSLSDTVSGARRSIKSSTDELFLPRADQSRRGAQRGGNQDSESAWQSTPLALALLPAVAGIFFHNGTAVFTDLTLLVLAAVFLNWSLRLPWDWYESAQGTVVSEGADEYSDLDDIPEGGVQDDGDEGDGTTRSPQDAQDNNNNNNNKGKDGQDRSMEPRQTRAGSRISPARRELQRHELAALASCFIFPLIGAWLLHTIRAQLSRPSEGLVSNYNLTIFLLAAEIRPVSHLLKLVQARTLHLQRVVGSDSAIAGDPAFDSKLLDLARRLDEIETHIAVSKTQDSPLEGATQGSSPSAHQNSRQGKERDTADVPSSASNLVAEVRNLIQQDIDGLNRALRRHERHSVTSSAQTDKRLRVLEARIHELITDNPTHQRPESAFGVGFVLGAVQWIWAAAVFPMRFLWTVASLPARMTAWCFPSGGSVVDTA